MPADIPPKTLDDWAAFPADRAPRPLLIIGDLPMAAPSERMPDELKTMTRNRAFVRKFGPVETPSGKVRVELPDGPAEMSLISAEKAFTAMARPAPDTVEVVRGELGSASFGTDMGAVKLPAWLFYVRGAEAPVAWPAIDPAALWKPGEVRATAVAADARLAPDGRSLTVSLPGPPDPCPGQQPVRYETRVIESEQAVAVGVRAVGAPAEDCVRLAFGRMADYGFVLKSALGGRVLVDAQGGVIPVTRPPSIIR
ncbi:hypothetical protein SAMN05444920_12276 [Nonomuraea solani]|uniref:Uncharacterized protein n=1 Tax=Nonomuraea solani TaxID=1144553 RepID=A0A1H6EY04_9ACTN|nr:hypothetical protein SAMN05444920_12276 [Nonomuraea solani]